MKPSIKRMEEAARQARVDGKANAAEAIEAAIEDRRNKARRRNLERAAGRFLATH